LNALRHFGFGKRSIESKIVEEAGFFVEVLEKNKGLPVVVLFLSMFLPFY
jgi:hypothetical protein